MGPGWEPTAKGWDIWQLEPSQKGNLWLVRLCYNSMASTHKCKKTSSIHFARRFPWVKCFAPSKARLRHFGLATALCQNTPVPQANTSYHQQRAKRYETSATVSASLTTQSCLGQGLVEQYVPVRTPLNPDIELRRQETYSFSHLILKGKRKRKKACSVSASRYHHVLYHTATCLHVDDPGDESTIIPIIK